MGRVPGERGPGWGAPVGQAQAAVATVLPGRRATAIEAIGEVPWGIHFCLFYATKEDLLEILVPYFKAGLENDESCIWITSGPLGPEEAWAALGAAMPELGDYRRRGRIEVVPHTDWHLRGGRLQRDELVQLWFDSLEDALARGCTGLRVSGNVHWLEKGDWAEFAEYEAAVDAAFGREIRILALCCYPLERCGAVELGDVVRNHRYALWKRDGRWQQIGNRGLSEHREHLEALVRERTRELEAANARLRTEIRDRERAEETLIRERSLLASVMQATDVMLVYLDREFDFVWVNAAYAATCKMRPEEMVGKNHFALYPHAENEAIFRRVRDSGEPVFYKDKPFEFPDQPERGVTYWDWSLVPVKNGAGVLGLVFSLRETTQYKRAELALRASEARFKTLFDTMSEGFAIDEIICDEAGRPRDLRYLEVNPAFERHTGLRAADVVGRTTLELFPDAEPTWFERYGKVALTGEPARFQAQFGPLGRWFEVSCYRTEPGRFATVFFDITDRKRWEEALYARSLIEASLDPLVTISPEGKITDVSRATEEITGVDRDRLVGTDFADYFTEPEKARAGYRQVLSAGAVRDYPLTIRHVGGRTTDVLYNATIYRGQGGEPLGVFAAARDITERKRAESERQRMEEQLRQSQKLEAIGRLAGGVAHDFNNLLTAIIAASSFLLESLPGGEPLREEASDIQGAAKRAAALTRQLLTFSRNQVVEPRVLDLNDVVATMDRMLRRLIGENIELVARTAPGLGRVLADPGQIEQVIVNLAVNARDAMPGGGRITLETANVDLGEDVTIPGGPTGGRYAMLAIRDTGHGMTAEVLSHLFEPFFTTKGPGKGTGLGLSTVYGIVKQAGGDVRVKSEPGKGSAFEVYLPRVDAPAEDAADVEASPPPRGTETVLLVEDEPIVRKLEAKALRSLGYTVEEASDGEDAWRLAAGRTGEIDLVVTDVVMPRMGGKELADQLRGERPGIAILFVSGYTDQGEHLRELVADASLLLQKPFTPNGLARRVREVLDRRGRDRNG